jgi:hypothetical protein
MTQRDLDRAVAEATGEPVRRISRSGFTLLTRSPVEREPLTVDWDALAAERPGLFADRRVNIGAH